MTVFLTGIGEAIVILNILSQVAVAALVAGASYLLQRIITPRAKPSESPHPDLQLTTSREGGGIPRIYNTAAVGGQVIWLGPVITRPVFQASGKRSSPPTTEYVVSMGILVCENRNGSVLGISRMYANGNELYSVDPALLTGTNPDIDGVVDDSHVARRLFAQRMQILLGQESQTTRCPWYATSGNNDDYPAYRGSVVVWLENVLLTPSYNQIPQYQFEVVSDGDIITGEATYAGIAPSDIVIPAAIDMPPGWIISGPTAPKQTFEALSIYTPFDCAEVDGKLKFILQPQSSSVTVPDNDLGAVASGREEADNKEPKFVLSSEQSLTEVAQRVEVTFFDPEFKYEEGTAGYALQFGQGTAVKEVFLPASLNREQARNRAAKLLARTRMETDTLKVTLPPKYIKYHPGDVLTIPAPNSQLLDLRIINMEFAPSDKIVIEGVRQLRSAGVGPPDISIITPGEGDEGAPLDTIFILSNAPPLIDDHDGFDGIYWAAGPRNIPDTTPPGTWIGATLYMNFCGSDDTFKQYYPIAHTRTAAVIGKARTVLATGSGVDTTNTVDIEFPYGLGTSTVLGILNDAFVKTTQANLCILGKEVLQFRDVDDVSELYPPYEEGEGKVWRLSHLKRGIRDTAAMTTTHVVSEGFVMWSIDALHRVPIDIIQQDNTWSFKSITSGQAESEIDPAFFEYDPNDGTLTLMETP